MASDASRAMRATFEFAVNIGKRQHRRGSQGIYHLEGAPVLALPIISHGATAPPRETGLCRRQKLEKEFAPNGARRQLSALAKRATADARFCADAGSYFRRMVSSC
jgi:hypothetical protein